MTPLEWVWKGLRIFATSPRLSQDLPLSPPEQLGTFRIKQTINADREAHGQIGRSDLSSGSFVVRTEPPGMVLRLFLGTVFLLRLQQRF